MKRSLEEKRDKPRGHLGRTMPARGSRACMEHLGHIGSKWKAAWARGEGGESFWWDGSGRDLQVTVGA